MALIKWSPLFEPMEEFNRFFEDHLPLAKMANGFTPAIDLYQTKNEIIAETPLPGIDPERIDISIENDVLTVKGEFEKKNEVEEKDYFRKEVRHGSFYRSVALPAHVLSEKASASYENGILKIAIPKSEEVKPKTIKVKTVKK